MQLNVSMYLLIFFSLLIGVFLAAQAGINAQLRTVLASPIQAAFISFLFGTIILGVVAFSQNLPWFEGGSLSSLPWWAWLGGALGAFNIAMSVYLAPKLGAVALTVTVVCGQMITALVLDQNAWLGYPKIELSATRIIGALLMILGMFLVVKK